MMLSQEESLKIGLQVLERFKPGLSSRLRRKTETSAAAIPLGGPDTEPERHDQPARRAMPRIPSLQAFLRKNGGLPAGSVLLGMCEDHLPFTLDLADPTPGSVLIAGDRGSGKSRLLKSLLASAIIGNSPASVAFSLVAQNQDEYAHLTGAAHCFRVCPADDGPGMRDLVDTYSRAAELRRRSNPRGPALILALDDLQACLENMDSRTVERLLGLIKHGPRNRIWPVATLASEGLDGIDPRLLEAFRTVITGSIASPEVANHLAGEPAMVDSLQPGQQFGVPFGPEWVRFWVCDPV